MLRDTYQAAPTHNSPTGIVDELLDPTRFPTPQHITNHLLDHAILTAYTPQPGQPRPRYTPQTAHHTLIVIAQHLRDRNTYDLAWWHIPAWIPCTPRTLITAGLHAIIGGLTFGLAGWVAHAHVVGLVFGIALGLLIGLSAIYMPSQMSRFRWEIVRRREVLAIGLAIGLVGWLAVGLVVGLVFGLMTGLVVGLVEGLDSGDVSKVAHPQDLWRADFFYGLGVGLVVVLVFAL